MEKGEIIELPIGGYAVVNGGTIACRGLGSCVAMILYSRKKPIGGMAHTMLPAAVRGAIEVLPPPEEDARYVDKAADLLIGRLGRDCEAKLVGGASLFGSDDIGERNVEAARKKLGDEGIRVISEDTGGSRARSCFFFVDDRKVVVRTSVRVGFDVRFLEKII